MTPLNANSTRYILQSCFDEDPAILSYVWFICGSKKWNLNTHTHTKTSKGPQYYVPLFISEHLRLRSSLLEKRSPKRTFFTWGCESLKINMESDGDQTGCGGKKGHQTDPSVVCPSRLRVSVSNKKVCPSKRSDSGCLLTKKVSCGQEMFRALGGENMNCELVNYNMKKHRQPLTNSCSVPEIGCFRMLHGVSGMAW